MTISHGTSGPERLFRLRIGRKEPIRQWNLRHIGGRLFKKLVFVGTCVAIILFLTSFDPGGVPQEVYSAWDWSGVDMVTWLGNMSERMSHRRHHLQSTCDVTGLSAHGNDSLHQPNVWEFLINRKHKLVWCNVFKAASTSWMYNFNILAGYTPRFLQSTKQVPLQLARKRYPRPTLEQLLAAQNDSTTFLIVRHPLERLLSGYRDKIEHALAHTLHQKLNNQIIMRYRKNSKEEMTRRDRLRKKTGRKTPTFSEFVDYLIDVNRVGKEMDMHWTPINTFCTPCQVHFDIIMKFETLEDDQNYLIHGQQLERWIRPQWKNPSKGQSKTSNLIKEYYSQLTSHQLYQLYDIYKFDMMIFNYTLDGYLEFVTDKLNYIEQNLP